jgi:hypothetical protein
MATGEAFQTAGIPGRDGLSLRSDRLPYLFQNAAHWTALDSAMHIADLPDFLDRAGARTRWLRSTGNDAICNSLVKNYYRVLLGVDENGWLHSRLLRGRG